MLLRGDDEGGGVCSQFLASCCLSFMLGTGKGTDESTFLLVIPRNADRQPTISIPTRGVSTNSKLQAIEAASRRKPSWKSIEVVQCSHVSQTFHARMK